jgi:ribonucleoside-diphosphate reductase alpha chain
MRIAMGLSFNEKNPRSGQKSFIKDVAARIHRRRFDELGAGTTRPTLSNCFLMQIEDDMEHIAKSVGDVMMLSKAFGRHRRDRHEAARDGLSAQIQQHAFIGPTPFAKIIDTAIRAVQRGGKKKGALCFYMENWHIDFPEFLDWKHNAGDDYMRMRTADTAAFISDEFMNRVENRRCGICSTPRRPRTSSNSTAKNSASAMPNI